MSEHKRIQFSSGSLLGTAISKSSKGLGNRRRSGNSRFFQFHCKCTLPGLALAVLFFAGSPMQPYAIASESSLDGNNSANLPEISIRAVSGPVAEGQNADFAVNSNQKGSEDLIVNVQVAQKGNYVHWWAPTKIRIPAGRNSVIYSLETEDDSLDEPNGAVTATVVSGDGYLLASESSATIGMLDNDSGLSLSDNSESIVTIAGAVARQILLESGHPKITITPVSNRIAKGQEAVFALTAHPVPMQDLDIGLEISGSGGETDVFPMTVSLNANIGSLLVPLDASRIHNSESITVSVSDGNGYRIGMPSEATVSIGQ